MNHTIDLDDDTSKLLKSLTALTQLADSDLIDKLLSAHLSDLYELLALVGAHPELREQAANLVESFGPDTLASGIKRIAPPGYETLGARFEREVNEVIGQAPALLQ